MAANETAGVIRAQALVRPNLNSPTFAYDLVQAVGIEAFFIDPESFTFYFKLQKPPVFEIVNTASPFLLVPDVQVIAENFFGSPSLFVAVGIVPSDVAPMLPDNLKPIAGCVVFQCSADGETPALPNGLPQITVLEYPASNGAFTVAGQPQVPGVLLNPAP
jgi:hypothetical protein